VRYTIKLASPEKDKPVESLAYFRAKNIPPTAKTSWVKIPQTQ
jgi:hypothetical protein